MDITATKVQLTQQLPVITDNEGRILSTRPMNADRMDLPINDLANGTYMLRVVREGENADHYIRCTTMNEQVHSVGQRLRYVGFSSLCLFTYSVTSQNLVPNGNFEDHDDCSMGMSFDILDYWVVPLGCVSQVYFNSCAPPPDHIYTGVPLNIRGFEYAHSGVGYLSLTPYISFETNHQSYVTSTLYDPLIAGEEYCVQFWMSLCDSSSYKTGTFHAYITELYLTVNDGEDSTWAAAAQLTFNTTAVDGNGWYLMEGSFVAVGGERRMTLGNFLLNDALLADTTFLGFHGIQYPMAAYYIDDVYLGPCDVGIEDRTAKDEAVVYPNPIRQGQELHVQWAAEGYTWRLHDAKGQLVSNGTVQPGVQEFGLRTIALAAGIYQLVLRAPNGTAQMKKVVVL